MWKIRGKIKPNNPRELPRWLRVKNLSALQETASSNPGSERYPGEGNGNPLQNTCLGNSMDREEPSGIQSMELQKIGHDLMTKHQQQSYLMYWHMWTRRSLQLNVAIQGYLVVR